MCDNTTIIINDIVSTMQTELNDEQLRKLENVLYIKLHGMELHKEVTDVVVVEDEWERMLKIFLASKRVENCSEGTISGYRRCIQKFHDALPGKKISEISPMDVRWYLGIFAENHNASPCYLDNMRRIFSSFFGWLLAEEYINSNPLKRVSKIKVPKKVKRTYTGEEREMLKCHAKCERDVALLDFLYSTALRVGEVTSVDRKDVDFRTRGITVYGKKGKKERIVYINEECAYHLKNYLDSRKDDNPALFVTNLKPHNRMSIGAIQRVLKNLGRENGVHCHPHKYRRTLLTDGANRGVPLQELQYYAGHVNTQTTMEYINIDQKSIKSSYDKLLA